MNSHCRVHPMNENETLRNKVVALGKLGFWMTAVTILISLLCHAAYQISLWSGDWLFEGWKGGFTAEDLKRSLGREIVCAVSLSSFLFSLATTIIILLLFRAMWEGRAISRRTANLATVLGILCVLGIFDLGVEPLPLEERSDGEVGKLTFSVSTQLFREFVIGILAVAAGRVIRFANEQERQLDEIV